MPAFLYLLAVVLLFVAAFGISARRVSLVLLAAWPPRWRYWPTPGRTSPRSWRD